MESQPQNPEFKNSPENFHPCIRRVKKEETNIVYIKQYFNRHFSQFFSNQIFQQLQAYFLYSLQNSI